MAKSLLFLPDISGFTKFVQTTEVSHSQHVISELLEVLINANTLNLQLAEVEGDALFFYKEEEVPSFEKLLILVETMFTAFYNHLKLLEKNRVCPCNACSSAPKLQLKIIAHSGELQFITVQNKRKPFGIQVIEAHRLMKNSVKSDNYLLFSKELTKDIKLPENYSSNLFSFKEGKNIYDDKELEYLFSIIDKQELKLDLTPKIKKITFDKKPTSYLLEKKIPTSAPELLEYITNYAHRNHWMKGVDKIDFNKDEVTRIGSEHVCTINDKELDFIAVTKKGKSGQLVFGEMTTNSFLTDKMYLFYIITPINKNSCNLEIEIYLEAKSPIKKLMITLILKHLILKSTKRNLENLIQFVKNNTLK